MYCICPHVYKSKVGDNSQNTFESLFALHKPVINRCTCISSWYYKILILSSIYSTSKTLTDGKTYNSRFLYKSFMTNIPSIGNRRIYMYEVGKQNQSVTSLGNTYKSLWRPVINLQMCIVLKYLKNPLVIGEIWFLFWADPVISPISVNLLSVLVYVIVLLVLGGLIHYLWSTLRIELPCLQNILNSYTSTRLNQFCLNNELLLQYYWST